MAHILVYLETQEGLEEKITLKLRHYTRIHILDYEGVPLCCRRCHKVGHIYKECLLIMKTTDPLSTPSTQKGKAAPNQTSTLVSAHRAPGWVRTSKVAEEHYTNPSPTMTCGSATVGEATRKAGNIRKHNDIAEDLSKEAKLLPKGQLIIHEQRGTTH